MSTSKFINSHAENTTFSMLNMAHFLTKNRSFPPIKGKFSLLFPAKPRNELLRGGLTRQGNPSRMVPADHQAEVDPETSITSLVWNGRYLFAGLAGPNKNHPNKPTNVGFFELAVEEI